MTVDKLFLIGGGGHCRSCIEILENLSNYVIAGIVDLKELLGKDLLGYAYCATDECLPRLIDEGGSFLITLGQTTGICKRYDIFNFIKSNGGNLPSIVASTAFFSRRSELGIGTIVMNHSFVNCGVRIGDNCIINTKSLIEHDSIVSDHTHISTGTIINGNCCIGMHCFIGSGAVVSNGVTLCDNVVIGAGSVVIEDITKSGVYAGVPAKKIS